MKISFINPTVTNIYTKDRYNASISYNIPALKCGLNYDTFVKTQSFTGADKYTTDWYKELTPDKKTIINKRADEYIYNNPEYLHYEKPFNHDLKYNDITANCIKDTLNNKYGEGNYIVIPIGRSLSSIVKNLGYKIGEDNVKLLPMSSAGRFLDLEKCDEDFGILTDYLDSIGLSKDNVKKSDKQYIFIDYCCSGRSLQGAENLFKSNKMWGQLDNIHFENIMNLLPEPDQNKEIEGIPSVEFLKNLELDLLHSRYKKYALVKDCPRLKYLNTAIIDPNHYSYEKQVFYWKLLDKEFNK